MMTIMMATTIPMSPKIGKMNAVRMAAAARVRTSANRKNPTPAIVLNTKISFLVDWRWWMTQGIYDKDDENDDCDAQTDDCCPGNVLRDGNSFHDFSFQRLVFLVALATITMIHTARASPSTSMRLVIPMGMFQAAEITVTVSLTA